MAGRVVCLIDPICNLVKNDTCVPTEAKDYGEVYAYFCSLVSVLVVLLIVPISYARVMVYM